LQREAQSRTVAHQISRLLHSLETRDASIVGVPIEQRPVHRASQAGYQKSTSLHAADAVQRLHKKAAGNAGKYRITARKRPGVHRKTTPRGA